MGAFSRNAFSVAAFSEAAFLFDDVPPPPSGGGIEFYRYLSYLPVMYSRKGM